MKAMNVAKPEATMRPATFAFAALLSVLGSQSSFAAYYQDGQQSAPPALAAQMALPECGFAATESWGANGHQLCDARNVHGSLRPAFR